MFSWDNCFLSPKQSKQSIILLIYFCYSVFTVWGMGTFEFAEAIGSLPVLVSGNIVGYIKVPPGVVIVDTVPGVAGG